MSIAVRRLNAEYERWQKIKDDMPGFEASPTRSSTGSIDYFRWLCIIPGPSHTPWEGGKYPLTIVFTESFPTKPPLCSLPPGFVHINVFESGAICLDIIKEGKWNLKMSVPELMVAVQKLLNEPNASSPANACHKLPHKDYEDLIRKQARKYR